MNPHLETAVKTYEEHGIDFQQHLAWHMSNGAVVCDPDRFGLYYFTHSQDLGTYTIIEDADTLFVTFYTGNITKALAQFIDDFKYVSFSRDFQNSPRDRVYPIKEFNRRITK